MKGVQKIAGGGIKYRGTVFKGFNKPQRAPEGSKHKMTVLAKQGDQVKKVNFGDRNYEDFTTHGSAKRRENYLKRSAGIRDGSGKPTKNNKLSANYWARKVLW